MHAGNTQLKLERAGGRANRLSKAHRENCLQTFMGITVNIVLSVKGITKFEELKTRLAFHELEEVNGLASEPIWEKIVYALQSAGYEGTDFKPLLNDLGTMGPEKLAASMKCEQARAQASLRYL